MIKYTCNVWHAAKVTFANEIGNIAKAVGVDGREVMDVICQDHKLNLSRYYMRPGFAFGGSCLPRMYGALTYRASQLDVEHPMLGLVDAQQLRPGARGLRSHHQPRHPQVGLLGLSFKAGTDDLREPAGGAGRDAHRQGLRVAHLRPQRRIRACPRANKEYIESKIPHVSSLLVSDLDEVVASSDVLVLGAMATSCSSTW
ncbi:hypothetical protein ACPA9J_16710 [Pseudomonas aeruginosa]